VAKLDQLKDILRSCGRTLVAYSGGVDSVFLAKVSHDVLGGDALAVIADSPSLPRRELEEAVALGRQFNFPVRVVHTHEMNDPSYTANPTNRCYFCKSELFDELAGIAKTEGFATIVYGENASDVGDYRPGAQAAKEYRVRAPLKEAGLTKTEIRELSAQLGLPTADKPQMACLSSRIPTGEPVTVEALAMIEAAENVLRDLGFHDVRVRHHELNVPGARYQVPGNAASGGSLPDTSHLTPRTTCLARIEVGVDELPKFLGNGISLKVAELLRQIGYSHVTVDLQGYRRGGTDTFFKAPGA